MKLVLDVGNSRLKWALSSGEVLPCEWVVRGVIDVRIDDLTENLSALREVWSQYPSPDCVIAASVRAPPVNAKIADSLRAVWNVDVNFLSAVSKGWGIVNAYDEPETLGVDRYAAMVAAHAAFGGPAVVVDFGSAVTVDVVSTGGEHLGGVIFPGPGYMRDSLYQRTDKIILSGELDDQILGTSTSSAVASGITLATCGAIEKIVENVMGRLPNCSVVSTGGGAPQILPSLNTTTIFVEDLVLQGVARMGLTPT